MSTAFVRAICSDCFMYACSVVSSCRMKVCTALGDGGKQCSTMFDPFVHIDICLSVPQSTIIHFDSLLIWVVNSDSVSFEQEKCISLFVYFKRVVFKLHAANHIHENSAVPHTLHTSPCVTSHLRDKQ